MRTHDSKGEAKKAERQREISGKFPFHRVDKLIKMIGKIKFMRSRTKGK